MNIKGLHTLISISLLVTTLNCSQRKEGNEKIKEVVYFDPFNLGANTKTDNFKFETLFRECGEWGGHEEEIFLTADRKGNYYANYKIYLCNCDSARNYGFSKRQGISKDTIVKLNDLKKEAVVNYIHLLTQSKISAQMLPSHAANHFSAIQSDSSFIIELSEDGNTTMNGYKKFVSTLLE